MPITFKELLQQEKPEIVKAARKKANAMLLKIRLADMSKHAETVQQEQVSLTSQRKSSN